MCIVSPDLRQEATAIPIVEVNGGLAGQWNEENPDEDRKDRGCINSAAKARAMITKSQFFGHMSQFAAVSVHAGVAIASWCGAQRPASCLAVLKSIPEHTDFSD